MSIFSNVTPIRYEGPETNNDLAYRVYNKDRVVLGKRLEDWFAPRRCATGIPSTGRVMTFRRRHSAPSLARTRHHSGNGQPGNWKQRSILHSLKHTVFLFPRCGCDGDSAKPE